MTSDFSNPSEPGYPPHPYGGDEVDFREYLQVLMRRRRTFLIVFCIVFFCVAIYTFAVRPVFEASTTVHVREERPKTGDLSGILGLSSQNPVATEIEIIKSRTIAEQVVKRLHLNRLVTDKSDGFSFRIDEFTAPPDTKYRVRLGSSNNYTVLDEDNRPVAAGLGGQPLQKGQLRVLISDIKGKPGDCFDISLIPLREAAGTVMGNVEAAEVKKGTSIIRISYHDNDPVRAQEVVNTLAQAYLELSLAYKTQEANKTLEFIGEHMGNVRNDLDSAEKNLQVYKAGTGIVKLDSEAEGLVGKISETEKKRVELSLQRRQAEFALASLRDAVRQGKVYTPAAGGGDNPGISVIAAKLVDLEVQKRALLSDSTASHPQVRAIQAQIDEVQKKLAAVYETTLKNLTKDEATVTQTLGSYEGMFRQLPEVERDLAQLTRHTKVNSELYTFLLQKHEEARIAKTSTISNLVVIDPALLPLAPVKPKKAMNLLLGLLVGLFLGAGVAFVREYLDDTIKDAEGARRELDAPILAVIPHIHHRIEKSEVDDKDGNDRKTALIVRQEPKSSVSEAFRSLRTGLHFSAINRKKKLILVTSTLSGEGKTTIASNLAVIMAQTGVRVLLMDCDLRRPKQHEMFSYAKSPGLSEVLAGDVALDIALHDTGTPGVDFIAAGTTPPNPAELLSSESMSDLLKYLKERYDHIIVDSPPVLAVTDAPLLSACCDLVVVVLETERVPVKAAQRMAELLGSAQAPVAGIVVNDKSGHSGERYGYYGGRYGYGSYRYGYGYGYGYGEGYYSDEHRPAVKEPWWRRFFFR